MISYDTLMKNVLRTGASLGEEQQSEQSSLLTQMIPCGLNSVYAARTDIYMQAYQGL